MRKWIPFLLLFIVTACGFKSDRILSQREMRNFLTDLHVLEGLIMNDPEIGNDERIEVYYYNALFSKHHITKAVFDSSLVFYTKQPKRFERIYAGVIRKLEKLQTDVIAGKYERVLPDSIRLKPFQYELPGLDTLYVFTPDSPRTKLPFAVRNVPLLTKDIYHLRFRLRREPSDSSVAGYAALRIHYADGVVDSLWHPTQNDSVLRKYHFRLQAKRNLPIDSVSGVLLGTGKVKGKFRVYLDSVRIEREYIPFLQDSLRNQLDTVPVIIGPADTIDISGGNSAKVVPPQQAPAEKKKTVPVTKKAVVIKSEEDDR